MTIVSVHVIAKRYQTAHRRRVRVRITGRDGNIWWYQGIPAIWYTSASLTLKVKSTPIVKGILLLLTIVSILLGLYRRPQIKLCQSIVEIGGCFVSFRYQEFQESSTNSQINHLQVVHYCMARKFRLLRRKYLHPCENSRHSTCIKSVPLGRSLHPPQRSNERTRKFDPCIEVRVFANSSRKASACPARPSPFDSACATSG